MPHYTWYSCASVSLCAYVLGEPLLHGEELMKSTEDGIRLWTLSLKPVHFGYSA